MKNISAAVTVVVLGFLVQLIVPRAAAPADASKSKQTAAGTAETTKPAPAPVDRALALLCEGIGLEAPCDTAGRYRTILVTIPDPVNTRLGVYFDRWIESIQRAVEQSGYTFDNHWFPWPPGTEAAKEESTPGVMLFRHTDGTRLAFFLVAETPSHGLHRDQMNRFLGYVRQCKLTLSAVAGPSFSGSFDSLARMLKTSNLDPSDIQIVSGTATDGKGIAAFRSQFPRFETTVRDDQESLVVLSKFLVRNALTKPTRVVILSESGTVYGQQSWESVAAQFPAIQFTSIQFPRDISVMRNAYQDDPNLASGKPAQGASVTSLQLPLRDAQKGSDTPPLLAGMQSAASQEAILLQIARQIRAQRADSVAIVATNALDVMFLAQFLKRSCPDIGLVLLEADSLFVRPPDSQILQGAIAVSTYPLFLRNQEWLQPSTSLKELLPFASNSTQGVFNAVRVLMGGERMVEYAEATTAAGWPPVWITIAGRDSYWPVSTHSPQPEGRPLYMSITGAAASRISLGPPPGDWVVLFGCTLIAMFAFAFQTSWARTFRPVHGWFADFVLPARQGRVLDIEEEGRAYFHLIVLLCLLAILLIVAGPVAAAVFYGARESYLVIGVFAAIAVAWLVWLGNRIVLDYLFSSPWLGTRAFVSMVLFFMLVFVYLFMATIADNADHEGAFLILRCLHLDSGVSPTIPLTLAALALFSWAWVNWQRMIFACERSVTLPQTPYPELHTQARNIQLHLAQPFQLREQPAIISLSLSMLATLLILDSFEYLKLDVLYRIVVGWVAGLLAVNFQIYLRLWWKLRGILERIEQLPMRITFSTLQPDLSNASLWMGSPYKRIYLLQARSVECLARLAKANPNYLPGLPVTTHLMKCSVDEIVRTETIGGRASLPVVMELRRSFARLAGELSSVLQAGHWRRTLPDTPAQSNPRTPDEIAEEFVVLQYVAFIRYALLQLRNYLTSFTTGFVLLALSLNSYPFQSTGRIRWMITVIFLSIGAGVVWTLAQMDRDAILSRLQRTTPGKLDLSFVMKIITIGIVPLLTAAGSQFPEFGRFLTSWVQPAISVLK